MSNFFYYMFYVFGISLYLYFFCIPTSILYIFLYLSCVHLSRLSYVFSMFLFFFRLHIMSLVYVFFVFRFYDLLHSMYYYVYHSLSIPYTLPISCHLLISYTFITFSCDHILIFISIYTVLLVLVTVYTFIA